MLKTSQIYAPMCLKFFVRDKTADQMEVCGIHKTTQLVQNLSLQLHGSTAQTSYCSSKSCGIACCIKKMGYQCSVSHLLSILCDLILCKWPGNSTYCTPSRLSLISQPETALTFPLIILSSSAAPRACRETFANIRSLSIGRQQPRCP